MLTKLAQPSPPVGARGWFEVFSQTVMGESQYNEDNKKTAIQYHKYIEDYAYFC
jgi:hypothetical protein